MSEDPQSDEFDVKLLNYSEKPSDFMPDRNKNAAFYFPYIEVVDPAKQLMDRDPKRDVWINNRGKLFVPPSGHVAGVYARVDEQRGVHKAPANESLMGATNVRYFVGKRHQELLNPQGVNCIRNINGAITVYGGRTVGGDRNTEWKYVNVRRVMFPALTSEKRRWHIRSTQLPRRRRAPSMQHERSRRPQTRARR